MGAEVVIDERVVSDREERANDLFADRRRVFADFELRVFLHSQTKEMEKVVQVDFPIGLRVSRKGQVLARLFPSDAEFDAAFVKFASGALERGLGGGQLGADFRVETAFAPLTVRRRLTAPSVRGGRVRGVDSDGITGRIFVNGRAAVPDPLAPNVHRDAN